MQNTSRVKKVVVWILIAGAVVFALFLFANILVYVVGASDITRDIQNISPADAILILGASVHSDGTLSPLFKERVDTAVFLYAAGKAGTLLVSGDNRYQDYNEVTPVLIYLTEDLGIPSEDVFLDYAGFDTYDSLYRAKHIFKADSLIIVTQPFHLPRALFLAHALSIQAKGAPAGNDRVSFFLWVRERFAVIKALFEVMTDTPPAYLGDPIPITKDRGESFEEEKEN